MNKWMKFWINGLEACPRRRFLVLWAFVICSSLGVARADDVSSHEARTLETFVRYVMLWGPEIRIEFEAAKPSPIAGFKLLRVHAIFRESVQVEPFYVSDDGKRVIQGSLLDLSPHPFSSTAERIALSNQPRIGAADAPVVLVVFSDFQCPMCRKMAGEIKSAVDKTYPGQLRAYFKDLPLSAKHPWAMDAAIAGRCVFRQNPAAFWTYHDWVFGHQSEITAPGFREQALSAIGTEGIDVAKLTGCMDSRETESEVKESIREASDLGVPGTPTVFLNGRKMPGPSWQLLRSAIDIELKARSATLTPDCGCLEDNHGAKDH